MVTFVISVSKKRTLAIATTIPPFKIGPPTQTNKFYFVIHFA
jgi:hypothetical protein